MKITRRESTTVTYTRFDLDEEEERFTVHRTGSAPFKVKALWVIHEVKHDGPTITKSTKILDWGTGQSVLPSELPDPVRSYLTWHFA